MKRQMSSFELYARLYLLRHRKQLIWAPLVLVAILFLWSVFYSVPADSEGVVLRFGRYARTTQPGLHMKLPRPLEQVIRVPVQRVQTLEFGFQTFEPGRVTIYERTEDDEAVALMLTGDLNLAHVEWIVQYRIKDAGDYLFRIGGDPDPQVAIGDAIRDVCESTMRKLVGDASVDEVIASARDRIAEVARTDVQEMLDTMEAGIDVVTIKLQAATPPNEVKAAFDQVNTAQQDKERVVNEAHRERNRMIPAARGERDRAISEAEGYKERAVLEITGRTNAFLAQLAEYEKAPEVTRTRLYLEAMESILSTVKNKTVIDESVPGVLPLLDLDRAGREGGAR